MKTKRNELKLNKSSKNKYPSPSPGMAGIVYQAAGGIYHVCVEGRMIPCMLASGMYRSTQAASDAKRARHGHKGADQSFAVAGIVVGDQVRLVEGANGYGRIVEVEPRRSQLSRRSAVPMPSAHASEQLIAANVDQVVPVFSAANPAPKWNMLDRYLALAESLELPALIVITKLDLVQESGGRVDAELLEAVDEYRRMAYPVILTSAVSGYGLDELRNGLRAGLSVLLGKSGVGKTALLNAIQPGLGLRVREVSQVTGKGRHTTTSSEIFPLESGGMIIDTPGVREFGLWDLDGQELAYFFREMEPLVGACRFGLGCQHDEEPGCAIRRAVAAGGISPRRYQSYLRLREELGAA